MKSHFGIRPDAPYPLDTDEPRCDEYKRYVRYAQDLQEAYHSRATQNRGWLYVAAILGLGVMAASGGLAIATTTAAGTLGLLSISGAFAASSFATIDNKDLALSYTVAANSVDQSLTQSRDKLTLDAAKKQYTQDSCAAAVSTLNAGVTAARTDLEVKRTNNAAGALARAKDQRDLLNAQIAAVQAADPTRITQDAEITKVNPVTTPLNSTQPTPVVLTVRVKLGQGIGIGEVKVAFGTKQLDVDSIGQPNKDDPYTYEVAFKAPPRSELGGGTDEVTIKPELVIQGKTRVKSAANVEFTYKKPVTG